MEETKLTELVERVSRTRVDYTAARALVEDLAQRKQAAEEAAERAYVDWRTAGDDLIEHAGGKLP